MSGSPLRSRVWIGAWACALALAGGCASAPGQDGSEWERQTRLAGESLRAGDSQAGVDHYARALEAALTEPGNPGHIAYANWHLGDACYRYPGTCADGEAERKTRISLAVFGELYGPEHPVVIPILLRLSAIEEGFGDAEAARALLEQADHITARSFPESHFMRARTGTHRPASDLHPLEVLQILSEVDPLAG